VLERAWGFDSLRPHLPPSPLDEEKTARDNMPVSDAPTPLPVRASDAERERVIGALRRETVLGRLPMDELGERVGRVYGARHQGELHDAVADLTVRPPLAARLVARMSEFIAALEAAWREPRIPRLALPAGRATVTVGRSPRCDCVISDPTVSRAHARLSRRGDRWFLADFGSTNGTRVNGWRVTEEVEVRPGDRVTFGTTRYRLTFRA
jgi:FHA domain/Domain of unknown function (DUF1707)